MLSSMFPLAVLPNFGYGACRPGGTGAMGRVYLSKAPCASPSLCFAHNLMFVVTNMVFHATWLFVEHAPSARTVGANIACFACNGPFACPRTVGLVGTHGWPQVVHTWCYAISLSVRRPFGGFAFGFVLKNGVHAARFTGLTLREGCLFHG